MNSLVTRFHLLLAAVTLAITGVALFRVPAEFLFVARWSGGTPLWQWPRDIALAVGPGLSVLLLVVFFVMGRLFTKNQFAKSQHILDPALSLVLAIITATQLGLLLNGFGSDLRRRYRSDGNGVCCSRIWSGTDRRYGDHAGAPLAV